MVLLTNRTGREYGIFLLVKRTCWFYVLSRHAGGGARLKTNVATHMSNGAWWLWNDPFIVFRLVCARWVFLCKHELHWLRAKEWTLHPFGCRRGGLLVWCENAESSDTFGASLVGEQVANKWFADLHIMHGYGDRVTSTRFVWTLGLSHWIRFCIPLEISYTKQGWLRPRANQFFIVFFLDVVYTSGRCKRVFCSEALCFEEDSGFQGQASQFVMVS